MSYVMDVLYEFESEVAKNMAIFTVFSTIDQDAHLLNTQIDPQTGTITRLDNWNEYWRVSTQCPGAEMFLTRFNYADYLLLKNASIPGLNILAAGYPSDEIESMVADGEVEFVTHSHDADGNQIVTPVDLALTDDDGNLIDERIAPTIESIALYRQLWPKEVIQVIDGQEVLIERGNFARLGMAA